MTDQPFFGVFKEEKSLAVSGEPYDKPTVVLSRHRDKQFLVANTSAVTGNGRDAWFDKNMQLATPSSSYIDPVDLPSIVGGRAGPGAGVTQGSGPPLHDKPFRPSNPAQRSGRAAGSHYGTFGPMSMFLVAPEGDGGRGGGTRPVTAPVENSRGNIYTSKPKKAGPGYPDQYRLLAGKAYEYVPDEYQRGRILEKALKHEARARIHKPFWGGARASGCFTPDSELYSTPASPSPPRRSASTGLAAWRPTNPPARGPLAAFSSPAYIPCPEPREKPQLVLRPSTYAPSTPTFIPSNAGHKRLSMWSVNPYERGPPQPRQLPARPASLQPPPTAATATATAAAS